MAFQVAIDSRLTSDWVRKRFVAEFAKRLGLFYRGI
jgi:hypothetical protein